jgi:hypothetical protein
MPLGTYITNNFLLGFVSSGSCPAAPESECKKGNVRIAPWVLRKFLRERLIKWLLVAGLSASSLNAIIFAEAGIVTPKKGERRVV